MKNLLDEAKPIITLLLVCAVLIGGIVWMMNGGLDKVDISGTDESQSLQGVNQLADYNVDIVDKNNPIAVLNTNKGVIEIELFENQMPITAGNFAKLVDEGFYDGVKFHRVIEGFMIQGGDPITKTDKVLQYGSGDPGYTIPDEHIAGELLTNVRGTISMANRGPNTGGSQFFVNLADNKPLDFNVPDPNNSAHPVFGRVVSGMEVVDEIGKVETNQVSQPLEPVVIESATLRRN